MNEIFFEVTDAPGGGYTARAMGASIYTEADTRPELREAVRDAVRCHFEKRGRPTINRASLRQLNAGHRGRDA